MSSFAAALAKAWTRFYTLGLPADVKADRRAEIESDLWEQSQAVGGIGTAGHILARTLFGWPADIIWRAEVGAAVRSGKDLNVKDKTWNKRRVLALIFALVVLPVPPGLLKSAIDGLNPTSKPESNLSTILLAIGANVSVMPIGLGVLTIFYDGLGVSAAELGVGFAEIGAGIASFGGLYLARMNPALGLAFITAATATMAVAAAWALPVVLILGVGMAVMAVVRWVSPPPTAALAA